MDTAVVHKKLLLGEFKIKPQNKKSVVWDTFGIVSDLSGVEQDFVACISCSHVLQYKKNSTGTSSMKKHRCGVLAKGQPTLLGAAISHQPPVPSPQPKQLSQTSKDRVTTASVDFCAEDLQPYDTVAGKGFHHIINVVSVCDVF